MVTGIKGIVMHAFIDIIVSTIQGEFSCRSVSNYI